jgi:hypothetical protein
MATPLGVVEQFAAERHRRGDVLACWAEEVTGDGRGAHRAISRQIRPAASAASRQAA